MNTIADNSTFLNPELIDSLYPYQVDSLCRKAREYMKLNKEAESHVFRRCPKCGADDPELVDGGYTHDKYGKQKKHMLRCRECNRRFVEDHGQLTYYSHSDVSVWNRLIEDTIKGESLAYTAGDINMHTVSVFRMRHKFLDFLERSEDRIRLDGVIEIDEKYTHEAHKGLLKAEIDHEAKKITIYPQTKKLTRGLGNDKICIITSLKRQSDSYCKAYNTGKPSNEDVEDLSNHIKDGSYIFTDGITVYEKLLKQKHCTYKELVDISSYDQINHLGNVNSFHSRISEYVRQYRGVNSIYINRYAALYSLRQRYTGCDSKEILLKVLKQLKLQINYFYQRQLTDEHIFKDEHVMNARKDLTASVTINRLVRYYGYSVNIVKSKKTDYEYKS